MNKLAIVCPGCFAKNLVPDDRLGDNPGCGRCHEKLFQGKPVEVTGPQLQKMIANNDIPVVVDYWASWCGPCQMFAPTFQQAAQQLEPHVRLVKLDTEANQQIAAAHNIRSIPTLTIFHGGAEVGRQSGALPPQQFHSWVSGVIG